MDIVNNGLVTANIVIVIGILFLTLYIWRSGKNRERLYFIVPLLIVPLNILFFIMGQRLETADRLWPTTLTANLIAFMAICLTIGYLWYANKISSLTPRFLFLLAMAVVALSHMVFSLFYWWL